MKREAFHRRLDSIHDLPTLPQAALKINQILDNPGATIKQVEETIRQDQAIVPKLLRLVNSSFFGLEKKVSSISRAVIILGFNTVRNALVSVSIIDSLKGIGSDLINLEEFWRHAISCAVISQQLAIRSGVGKPEDAFTAGLIHDIGKLVLAKYFPVEFSKIMSAVGEGATFYEAETGMIPMHHNQVGAYLAGRWHLPQAICNAMKYSHGRSNMDEHPMAAIVYCAEVMLGDGTTREATGVEDNLPAGKAMEWLRLQTDSAQEWLPEIEGEIESACLLLLGEGSHGR